MQSKISCFNKTIFKKNLTRFWPFAVIYALYLIFAHPLALYVMPSIQYTAPDGSGWNAVAGHFTSMTEPISIFIFAIIMVTAVFGYLFQNRSTNMLHTFPVTRSELYVTNIISALVLMLVPQFFTALITNFVIIGKTNELIWAVWAWFGISVGETIFFTGFAALAVMFTGQLLPAIGFYVIWNLLYVIVVGLIDAVAELFIFGLSGNLFTLNAHVLFPLARFMRYVGFNIEETEKLKYLQAAGTGTLAAYVVVGLLLAAAAWYAYQKRALECAGDFLSFRFTRPIFRWAIAILGGAACSLLVTMMVCDGRGTQSHAAFLFVIWLVIFSAVLFFVAEMFIEKSFRVFKRRIAIECISCVAVLLVGVALLNFDVFGLESYVPDASRVEMAELNGDGSASFESEADIEKIVALHQLIVDRAGEHKRKENSEFADGDSFIYIGIHYRMTNGKKVDRSYPLQISDKEYMEQVWALFKELMYDTEAMKRSYFGMNYEELNWKVTNVALNYYTPDNDLYCPVYGTEEELQRFYEAALADIEAGAFSNGKQQYIDDHTVMVQAETSDNNIPMDATLELELMTDQPRKNIRLAGSTNIAMPESNSDTGVMTSTHLYLNSDCTHIIDLLIEMDVIDSVEDMSMETTEK